MPKSIISKPESEPVDQGKRKLLTKAAYVPPAIVSLSFLTASQQAAALNPPPIPSAPEEMNAVDEDEKLLQDLEEGQN